MSKRHAACPPTAPPEPPRAVILGGPFGPWKREAAARIRGDFTGRGAYAVIDPDLRLDRAGRASAERERIECERADERLRRATAGRRHLVVGARLLDPGASCRLAAGLHRLGYRIRVLASPPSSDPDGLAMSASLTALDEQGLVEAILMVHDAGATTIWRPASACPPHRADATSEQVRRLQLKLRAWAAQG